MRPTHASEFSRHLRSAPGPGRACGLWRGLRHIALVWIVFASIGAQAQASRPTDYQVKAAYLYNFSRFVEWPAKGTTVKDDSFTICVLGQDPFGATLDNILTGETVGSRSVAARRVTSAQELAGCQILFVSSSEESRLGKVMESLNKAAVLTVSDMPQFSQRGGMIQFVLEGNRVRFEVNLVAAQNAGLALSSELLKVATVVRRNLPPGN